VTDRREALLDELVAVTGVDTMREIFADADAEEIKAQIEVQRAHAEGVRRHGRLGYAAILDGEQGFPRIDRR
jgi:hypothetical protein